MLLVTQRFVRLYHFGILFQKTNQGAVISKKTPTTSDCFRNCEVPLYP